MTDCVDCIEKIVLGREGCELHFPGAEDRYLTSVADESWEHYQAWKKGGPNLEESGWIDVDPKTGEPLKKERK